MNTKICTSIEQSEKLLSLGLDPSTADMHYLFSKDTGHIINKAPFVTTGDEVKEDILFTSIDCWSLTALLKLISFYALEQTTDGKVFVVSKIGQYSKCSEAWDSSVDAAFEMVCWLIEQGHIKVNK
jgi:hypothetical protein